MNGDVYIGEWLVQPSLNAVSRSGETVHLQPKVMGVLMCLAQQAGEPVSKDNLLQSVWPDTYVTDDVLKRAISELRRIFEDDAHEPRIIQTIPKRGYRLVVPIRPNDRSESGSPAAKVESATRLRMVVVIGASTALVLIALGAVIAHRWNQQPDRGPSSQIHSIAVLPFENLSNDPTQEYFSEGVTDELITDLAQIDAVRVISRTSVMRYRKSDKSLPEIAHELNVDGIVEGTVQRSGDRVRITAKLIQASTDNHLWANSYEWDVRDVLALQRDVTAEIAQKIRARLVTRAEVRNVRATSVNPDAIEAYLQGSYHLRRQGRGSGDEEKRRAAQYFQQAIDADPNFANAYLGLGEAHSDLLRNSSDDLDVRKRAATKALELDSSLSEARAELAYLSWNDWDWSGAEEGYREAIAMNPNNAGAHDQFCILLGALSRLNEALRECQAAQALDPNEDHLSQILYFRREYDAALKTLQFMLANHPDDGRLHHTLFHVYAEKGSQKEAIEELEETLTLFGLPEVAARVQKAFSNSGYAAGLRELAQELEHLNRSREVFVPGNTAEIYAAIGDKDRAFYWLDQEYQHRDWISGDIGLDYVNTNPMLDPLRSDPRFKDLVRRVGLPP